MYFSCLDLHGNGQDLLRVFRETRTRPVVIRVDAVPAAAAAVAALLSHRGTSVAVEQSVDIYPEVSAASVHTDTEDLITVSETGSHFPTSGVTVPLACFRGGKNPTDSSFKWNSRTPELNFLWV